MTFQIEQPDLSNLLAAQHSAGVSSKLHSLYSAIMAYHGQSWANHGPIMANHGHVRPAASAGVLCNILIVSIFSWSIEDLGARRSISGPSRSSRCVKHGNFEGMIHKP